MMIFLFSYRSIDDVFLQWNKKHLFLSSLSGFFGVFLAQLCYCLGLRASEPSFTTPFMLATPIFVMIFAILLNIENNQKLKMLGLAISVTGTVSLIFVRSSSNTQIWVPAIFLTISTISNAAGIVIWRVLLQDTNLSPGIVANWSLLCGTFCMLVAFIIEPIILGQALVPTIVNSIVGCWTISFCSFNIMLGYSITYTFLAWATHRSSISIVALYASARPIFTVAISFIVSSKNASSNIIACFLLTFVMIGLIITSYSKKMDKNKKKSKNKEEIKNRLSSKFERLPSCSYSPALIPYQVVSIN